MRFPFTKRRIIVSVCVLLGLALVLFKTNTFSWQSVAEALGGIGLSGMLMALSMAVVQYIFVALRFLVLLPDAGIASSRICHVFTNGQLFNHVLPARAGDLYKILALKSASTDPAFSSARVVSALIVERTLSTVILVFLIAGFLDWSTISLGDLPLSGRSQKMLVVVLFVVAGAITIYLVQKKSTGLRHWLYELKRSFLTMFDFRRILLFLVLGTAMWLAEVGALIILATSLGIDLQIGQGLFALLLLNVGIAVPLTLANVGPYEAALVLGLGLWGMGTNEAVAIAVSHHFLQILALLILVAMFNVARLLGIGK